MTQNSNPLILVELSKHLGDYYHKSDENYAFKCPSCKIHYPQHAHKYKLEIDLTTECYNCWVCGTNTMFRGKTFKSLYRKMGLTANDYGNIDKFMLNRPKLSSVSKNRVELPKEFKFLGDNSVKRFENYLFNERGLKEIDIYKYHLGFCESGLFSNRIIIPSFDKFGNVNNFASRSIEKTKYPHMKLKNADENVINFELLTNFSEPVIICEGGFDSITIGDNSIPLFGKIMSDALFERLVEEDVPSVYIALDKDALKSSIRLSEEFIRFGKKVFLVEMPKKDPNVIGKKQIREIIDNTVQLDKKELIRLKFSY